MFKIKKSSELLWLFGIIFVALGVSICSKANLGVSMIAAPAFVVSEAILSFSELCLLLCALLYANLIGVMSLLLQ